MFKKKILLNNFLLKSKTYYKNLKKTEKIFKSFTFEYENFEIPILYSYEENFNLNFSPPIIKKFYKYKNIIIIGMGGSILGTKSIYSFFKNKIRKNLFFFDNLDQDLYKKFKKIKNIKNSCFIIVSKSGNTLETIINFVTIFSKSLMKNKLVFITENKDNILNNFANELNAEIIEHREFVGGRYSVLSEAGMFPAALMGLSVKKFGNLNGLLKNKQFVSCLLSNVANIYTLNQKKMSTSVILNYDSCLNDLGYWYQQLVGESLGKKGKGFTPFLSPAPKDHHSLLQLYLEGRKDKFFTFFSTETKKVEKKIKGTIIPKEIKFIKNKNLSSIINAQCEATQKIFKNRNIPFRHFVFKKKSEEELGLIFTFFVLETILLAKLMDVNPFDQPAVEEVKIETKKIISK